MHKRRIKRSVVTAAVLVGLSVSPQAQAGWLSDRWEDFTDSITDIKEQIEDVVEDVVEEITETAEESVIFLLQHGAGRGADYLMGLLFQLPMADGHVVFDLLLELMGNDDIITDEIMVEMMYNPNMVGLIEKSISAANTDAEKQERAEKFFALAVERFMPILMAGEIQIDIDRIPSSAIAMFSNLGSVENNDDGLEKAWENMFRSAMSSGPAAQAFFGLLMQLDPAYQKAMMDFMFLGKTGDGQFHTAESVNFIQAMVEGMMTGLNEGTMTQEDLGMLVQSLMPILATFDDLGNMTGMTDYGMRFFTVVASKAMTCQDPAAGQFAQMMAGMMPPGMILPVVTNEEVCGRVESEEAIALINSGAVNYMDSDNDGVPDFMDRFPGIDNRIDTDNDGIPDGADSDIDNDGIQNDADADVNGDGVIDNGPDVDGNGIKDDYDLDTDHDGIPDSIDPDIDNDGILNDADVDVNGDGINDNGNDTDGNGINDAHDSDIDGDGIDNNADADANGDGQIDDGKTDTDNDGIDNASDDDIDGDGIANETDADMDGDGIDNDADADVNGDGIIDNGPDTDGDGINDAHDSDIDGDGILNDADADADGDGQIDDGKADADGDGIDDASDADADGDGVVDDGKTDNDGDGIDDGSQDDVSTKRTETIVYQYGEDGILRDMQGNPVSDTDYDNDPNLVTNLVVKLPGNKSVIMEVDMDFFHIDANGTKLMASEILDDQGSRFIISMTADGFGKVFIGNDEGGFEMTGNLAGMQEGEELVFSVVKMEDGTLAGKTTIKPKGKALTFGSSAFQE